MLNRGEQVHPSGSDLNNNEIHPTPSMTSKKQKTTTQTMDNQSHTIGQIKRLTMVNFMCHKNFSIDFHSVPMQIVTGANGSGKSTIANAICLCLGAQARTTGRTANVQSFIRKGESFAELTLTLANDGREAYKPEIYGKEIHIVRRIGLKQSGYRILNESKKLISNRKETIDELTQALSLSPENPLCVLHQEIAKNFLLNNDPKKKYQFYMKVSQLDQMKQAYEDALHIISSVQSRIQTMKQKSNELFRAVEPYEREIRKIDIRREKQQRKQELEIELMHCHFKKFQQDYLTLQNELDQTQKTKDSLEEQRKILTNQMCLNEEKMKELENEKRDLVKDMQDKDGLSDLHTSFVKQKKDIQMNIKRLSNECEAHYRTLKEIENEQILIKTKLDNVVNVTQRLNDTNEKRQRLEREIVEREKEQTTLNEELSSLNDELNRKELLIGEQQSMLNCVEEELEKQKTDLSELKKIERREENVYGDWMSDCLKAIENENRFHKKPIGPIGRHIRCVDPRWCYAVEKHLAPVMCAFICTDNHDEKLLLEIFTKYSHGYRPTIFVMRHTDRVHDVSGTLDRIRRANLLSVCQVLRINNTTVECALIDMKQIEATILIRDLAEAKQIRQSGSLRWEKIDKKVKQVTEAWTHDGSNVKFDRAFRIYTNDKQPARYFFSGNSQSLSSQELSKTIENTKEKLQQIWRTSEKCKSDKKTIEEKIIVLKKKLKENHELIRSGNRELDELNATMPTVDELTIETWKERLEELIEKTRSTQKQFDDAKERKQFQHQQLLEVEKNCDNILKKVEAKKEEFNYLDERIAAERAKLHEAQDQHTKLMKKFIQLNDDIEKYQEKLQELNKLQPKKPKLKPVTIDRNIREVENELNAIVQFLKTNEDTQEQRRKTIDAYKLKRDAAQASKKTIDRCERQVQRLESFVRKREERFDVIASQHEYLLRHKFKYFMAKHQFDDSEIKIDHKKEELHIIVRHGKNQRAVASLSGGERSVSTFCFLLALWGSIYQPFRLLDEIDIYMDHQKRDFSLDLLYENTRFYSSSQHVIFTPQTIDVERWKNVCVPIFAMPTPKRSLT